MTILVACGLTREARVIRRVGMIPIAGGGDALRLEADLEDAITCLEPFAAVLSSGIAGALDPALAVGDVVIDGDDAPLRWLRATLTRHPGLEPGSSSFRLDAGRGAPAQGRGEGRGNVILGSDRMIVTAVAKAALRARTGAAAVDMESHIAARVAARHGLPYAALRIISDTADEDLPPAVRVGMKPDGGIALGAVLASLARHPRQLPALTRTGRHAGAAFRELRRVHHVLARAGIGQLDAIELALHVT